MKQKCIVMFSGGLDSRLVVKIMQDRGYDVIALYVKLPFSKDLEKEIKEFCKKHKVKIKVVDYTKGKLLQEYLKIIKKPKYGKGTGINPCVDCRLFMLKKAREYANKNKINLIASGEVLGQRPMSQHKKALEITKEESKLKDKLIRPLIEKGFQGRSRKKQIALAKKFKIKIPSVGGGCLLCERALTNRFKMLIKNNLIKGGNVCLLRIGRHFINNKKWIVLGRDVNENKIIEKTKGIKIIPKQPGPTAWINQKQLIDKAQKLIKKHSKHNIKEFEVK